jgi:hypothetical protein
MSKAFKLGDHVSWNSEAGRVRGTVMKKVVSDVAFKGYTHHATKEEPQYFIKSDKTDHVAIHKGAALRLLKSQATKNRTRGPENEERSLERCEASPSSKLRRTTRGQKASWITVGAVARSGNDVVLPRTPSTRSDRLDRPDT